MANKAKDNIVRFTPEEWAEIDELAAHVRAAADVADAAKGRPFPLQWGEMLLPYADMAYWMSRMIFRTVIDRARWDIRDIKRGGWRGDLMN